jgi:hypothetical protein
MLLLTLIMRLALMLILLQVSEEKAHQREDILKDQIRHLVSRLKVIRASNRESHDLHTDVKFRQKSDKSDKTIMFDNTLK